METAFEVSASSENVYVRSFTKHHYISTNTNPLFYIIHGKILKLAVQLSTQVDHYLYSSVALTVNSKTSFLVMYSAFL